MAQLSSSLLSWLWEKAQLYSQPRIVYNDIAAALAQHTSLRPRTANYTFESGHEDLLICLFGSVTAEFRGAQYRYPVEMWVPRDYGSPGVGVICMVRPESMKEVNSGVGDAMVVRPGQHVAVDGRVYHPYLREWGLNQRSSVVGLIAILQEIFAREPPIVARKSIAPPRPSPSAQPQTPALPPKSRHGEDVRTASTGEPSRAPPLPSKPGAANGGGSRATGMTPQPGSGPPLPPLPREVREHQRTSSGQLLAGTPQPQHSLQRHQHPPPLSPVPSQQQSQQTHNGRSPVSPITPIDHAAARYAHAPSLPQAAMSWPTRQGSGMSQTPTNGHASDQRRISQHFAPQPQINPLQQQAYMQPPQYRQSPGPVQYSQTLPMPPPAQPKPAAPDLLTDPFDISLSAPLNTGPAPPIPPNPEKEHLLQLLSETFVAQAHAKVQQSQAAVVPLMAQRHALLGAQSALQSELRNLAALDAALATNEAILHQSMHDCQAAVEGGRKMAQPNIDELLVAPTMAAQQLWTVCADEAALREALWCLQQAIGAGRVSGAEFVRLTRSLAREKFLKMALMRKIASGLALNVKP